MIQGFADIMNQTGPLGQRFVYAELGGHNARQLGYFDRMAQYVLAVARTVPQTPQDLDEFRMQAVNACFIRRLFAGFADLLVDFLCGLFPPFLQCAPDEYVRRR